MQVECITIALYQVTKTQSGAKRPHRCLSVFYLQTLSEGHQIPKSISLSAELGVVLSSHTSIAVIV